MNYSDPNGKKKQETFPIPIFDSMSNGVTLIQMVNIWIQSNECRISNFLRTRIRCVGSVRVSCGKLLTFLIRNCSIFFLWLTKIYGCWMALWLFFCDFTAVTNRLQLCLKICFLHSHRLPIDSHVLRATHGSTHSGCWGKVLNTSISNVGFLWRVEK